MRKCSSCNPPSTIISIPKHPKLNLYPMDKYHLVNIQFKKNKMMATNKMEKIVIDLTKLPIVPYNKLIEIKKLPR